MSKKILVADDSATIQKVVSITLANEPCELIEVLDSDTLLSKIEEDRYALILLDFNLSEETNGYDLAKLIKAKTPNTKIIAMLGTFDSVEDDLLQSAGIDDVVVKPFESNKFIQSCRELLASFDDGEESPTVDDVSNLPVEEFASNQDQNAAEEEDDLAEGWVAKTPEMEDMSTEAPASDWNEDTPAHSTNLNALQSELEGWGMEVPSVIGQEEDNSLFPPRIDDIGSMEPAPQVMHEESTPVLSSTPAEVGDVTKPTQPFINIDDAFVEEAPGKILEEIPEEVSEEEINENVSFSVQSMEEEIDDNQTEETTSGEHHPSFQSIDDFNLQDENEETSDADKTVEIQMEQFDLEKEIEEEENPETFWAVDETEDPYSMEEKAGEIVKFGPHGNQAGEVSSTGLSEQDKEEIINALSEKVKAMVEDVVKQYCESKVDSVAWEVIPDLAENLINKEIKQISESL